MIDVNGTVWNQYDPEYHISAKMPFQIYSPMKFLIVALYDHNRRIYDSMKAKPESSLIS